MHSTTGSSERKGQGGSGAVVFDRRQNPARVVLPEFIRYHIDTESEHKGVAYYLAGAVISKEDTLDGLSTTCQVRLLLYNFFSCRFIPNSLYPIL